MFDERNSSSFAIYHMYKNSKLLYLFYELYEKYGLSGFSYISIKYGNLLRGFLDHFIKYMLFISDESLA